MQNIELLHEDYINQLSETDAGIAENKAILTRVEPGRWVRMITGSFYFVFEVVLYLMVFGLFFLAFYFYAHWLAITIKLTNDVSIDASLQVQRLDFIGNIITIMLVIMAFVVLGFALRLRSARRNLFKLADTSVYLEKTLAARIARRDKVIGILLEMSKKPE